jgi:hypothetical protein
VFRIPPQERSVRLTFVCRRCSRYGPDDEAHLCPTYAPVHAACKSRMFYICLFLPFLNTTKNHATIPCTGHQITPVLHPVYRPANHARIKIPFFSLYHSNHSTWAMTYWHIRCTQLQSYSSLPRICHTRAYLEPVFKLTPWRHNTASDALARRGWWQWHREWTQLPSSGLRSTGNFFRFLHQFILLLTRYPNHCYMCSSYFFFLKSLMLDSDLFFR